MARAVLPLSCIKISSRCQKAIFCNTSPKFIKHKILRREKETRKTERSFAQNRFLSRLYCDIFQLKNRHTM